MSDGRFESTIVLLESLRDEDANKSNDLIKHEMRKLEKYFSDINIDYHYYLDNRDKSRMLGKSGRELYIIVKKDFEDLWKSIKTAQDQFISLNRYKQIIESDESIFTQYEESMSKLNDLIEFFNTEKAYYTESIYKKESKNTTDTIQPGPESEKNGLKLGY